MFDVPLGDLMRGERATLGKSLLDVERELRIRATYIAAIENGDIGVPECGFHRGLRAVLCAVSRDGSRTDLPAVLRGNGVSRRPWRRVAAKARRVRLAEPSPLRVDPNDVMRRAPMMLAPEREPFLSRLEPGALGSIAVLLVLAAGIGYGAWAILQDVQRLSIAPVDEAPAPLAQLDPLAGATRRRLRHGAGLRHRCAGRGRRRPPLSPRAVADPGCWPRVTRRWRRSTPTRSARFPPCGRQAIPNGGRWHVRASPWRDPRRFR
jgi:hypothetical protein